MNMMETLRTALAKECRGWRKPAKRAYGEAYAKFLLGETDEPARPAELSYMGAQAVEISLRKHVASLPRQF